MIHIWHAWQYGLSNTTLANVNVLLEIEMDLRDVRFDTMMMSTVLVSITGA